MTKLPNGWEVKKLKDLGVFIRGVSYKKEQLLNEKDENSVFLLRANNIQSQLNLDELQIVPKELAENKIIQDNDILFAMSSGSKHIVGKNIILKDLNDFSFGAFCGVFRATDESLNPYFLSYYLKSFEYHKYIQGVSKGSNINNLRFKDLEEFQIPLPSLEEQRKIVKILDEKFASIDESIRLAKVDLLSLDELWQSILNDSFNPLKSKLDDVKYPKTWEIKKIDDLCEILDSKRVPISQKDRKSGKYPYYGATGIVDYIDNYIFDEELVLVGEDGAKWGACENTAFIASGKYWVNNHAHVLKPIESKIKNKFLVYYLNYADLEDYITGATVKKLNQQKLKQIQIPLPPLEEQERITKELESKAKTIKELKELYTKRLKDYEELKESLLDLAFKGGL